jgi:hypothetical protein
MARKLPIGIQSFGKMRRDGFVYVDKTAYVHELAQAGVPVFLSRPRRFGKTFAAESLVAYYTCGADSRELFEGLDISRDPGFERHLNVYNVVHLDMTAFRGADDVAAARSEMLDKTSFDANDTVVLKSGRNANDYVESDGSSYSRITGELIKEKTEQYIFRSLEYVKANGVGVILPVPQQPGVEPTERIITLTTCNPFLSSAERIIAYGVFDSWYPRAGGAPLEISGVASAAGAS